MGNNLFAWASIDENGHARGGKAGDQTGNEVKVGNYYHFGQTRYARFNDLKLGQKAAKIAKTLAENESIGYDQNQRTTLYNLAASSHWSLTKLQKDLKTCKVECDCSSFVATIINLTFERKLVTCFTTGTMSDALPQKYFSVNKLSDGVKFKKGDMVYKPYKHVIINI